MTSKKTLMAALFFMVSVSTTITYAAEETIGQKIDKSDTRFKQDAKDEGKAIKTDVKKGSRYVKDKTCRLVNGEMKCAAKKVMHKAENAADDVKDKVTK